MQDSTDVSSEWQSLVACFERANASPRSMVRVLTWIARHIDETYVISVYGRDVCEVFQSGRVHTFDDAEDGQLFQTRPSRWTDVRFRCSSQRVSDAAHQMLCYATDMCECHEIDRLSSAMADVQVSY